MALCDVCTAVVRGKLGQEMFHEERNVVATLAQRRQLNRNHVQAIEQIFAKRAGRDHPGEVRVRGGNHTHIHLDRLIVADALELPLLQGTQQLHLQRRARRPDFVQKERSLVCLLESTLSCRGCAGKRTSDVTEQLCFEQRFRYRAAVQRDEAVCAPRTVVMNRTRDDFFARSRFPVTRMVLLVRATVSSS